MTIVIDRASNPPARLNPPENRAMTPSGNGGRHAPDSVRVSRQFRLAFS
ncbi:MAG: hypothetical protein LBD67_04970 [Candidatus Accumulibacter sp.]|nr:hypothetical protein [Accumulibacter sp.]